MKVQNIDRYKVKFDIIMIFLVALASTIFALGLTWDDPFSLRVGVMMSIGLGVAMFAGTASQDISIDKKEWTEIMFWTVICASVIAAYNLFIRQTVTFESITDPMLRKLSSANVGISEEILFGMFLTPLFYRFTRANLPATLLAVMAIFMLYHIYVYGTDLQALMIVTGGRGILSLSVIMSRRVTSATLAHAGVNFLVT
jgi:membrane protease YdiL (CAAX protease family)